MLANINNLIVPVLFILALRGLSSANTAKKGNFFGIFGMAIAILGAILLRNNGFVCSIAIIFGGAIGYCIAKKIDMTALPQLLAAFHSLVGLAAVFIDCSIFASPDVCLPLPFSEAIEIALGATIGAITFSGSIVAFGKLQGFVSGKALQFKFLKTIALLLTLFLIGGICSFIIRQNSLLFLTIILASCALGFIQIIAIGGADMPVIVSMLNSYSGWAAAGIGFTLNNNILIIVGALVGTSGAILSNIMCKGMNRSLKKVLFGAGGAEQIAIPCSRKEQGNVKLCSPEDAAFIVKNASSVIIVPGYGMAVSQAQHVIKELVDMLKTEDISVKYAIHPVAGRMPGHMNVLLAEANIPYDDVFELDEINHEFGSCDIAIVIGANDITNPSAKTDPSSPIYGMPVLDVEKAKTVLFVKRSLGTGYAGIDNPLFYQSNTLMLLGDGKKVIECIVKTMET
ncbi:NAD(P) transhydrogenase subunit beta [Alphaproteobacteria bacterium]|nr:NAD(P) transhydrogenase subunit beta [Alphaproteobacteria bacterium]